MIVMIVVGGPVLMYLSVALVGHGYANTVDRIGLFLHRHAIEVRRRHVERQATLKTMWSKRPRRVPVVSIIRAKENVL